MKEELIEKRALRTLAKLAELAEIDDVSLVPVYIKVLSEPGRENRKIAIKVLKEIEPAAVKGAVPPLLNTLRESDHLDVRIAAALLLYQIDASKQAVAASALIEALAPENSIFYRIDAALALYQVDASQLDAVMDVLREGLSPKNDEGISPQREAVVAIAAIGEPAKEVVPVLVKIYKNRRIPYNTDVANALANIGAPSVPALIPALEDKHHETRHNVSELLKRIDTPEALKAVKAYEQRENHKSD